MSFDVLVWLTIALLMVIIEFFTVAFLALSFAIGALVPALVMYLTPSTGHVSATVLWLATSSLTLLLWRKIARPQPSVIAGDALVGEVGLIVRESSSTTPGEILLQRPVHGRDRWPCISSMNLPYDTQVKIISVSHSKDDGSFMNVMVEPVISSDYQTN